MNGNEDDDDDDVIILEDLCTKSKPNLGFSGPKLNKLTDELSPQNMQLRVQQRKQTDANLVKTPNVPRQKGSFFYRKYRDISKYPLTPATPKLDRNMVTPTRNGANHRTSSGRSYAAKQQNHDESITSDYSTPKTTRTLLTPNSTGGAKLRNGKRITHLIYRPLELDNESSSESTDSFNKRHELIRWNSQTIKKPLAIEAARPDDDQVEGHKVCEVDKPEMRENLRAKRLKTSTDQKREEIDGADENLSVSTIDVEESTDTKCAPKSDQPSSDQLVLDIDEVSQCITPPVTPEKIKDDQLLMLPTMPSFIPGNCNIDEVLKIYGSSKKDPDTKVETLEDPNVK